MVDDAGHVRPSFDYSPASPGKRVAHSLSECYLVDESQNRILISPSDFRAIYIFRCEVTSFLSLDDSSDYGTGRDGVHPQFIAQAVCLEDVGEVGGAQIAAQHCCRFVLRPFGHRAPVFTFLDQADVPTRHGAPETGRIPDLVTVLHHVAVHTVGLVVDRLLEVPCGQDPHLVGVIHHRHETLVLPELEKLVAFQESVPLVGGLHKAGEVEYGKIPRTSDGNCLEVLGPHDRADPDPAGVTAPVGVDAGVDDGVLAGRPDAGDLHVLVAGGFPGHVLAFQGCGSCSVGHGDHLDPVVLDAENRQDRGPAFEHDSVVTSLAKFHTEDPADTGVSVDTRSGRNCDERVLP